MLFILSLVDGVCEHITVSKLRLNTSSEIIFFYISLFYSGLFLPLGRTRRPPREAIFEGDKRVATFEN